MIFATRFVAAALTVPLWLAAGIETRAQDDRPLEINVTVHTDRPGP